MTPPASTYRLQIRRTFTLDDAATTIDYLAALGVGAVYLSPVLQSTVGSDHGYDTTDPTRIDADRGGEQGWAALLAAARRSGLQVVVDIVPNHVGIGAAPQNPYWWDVLTYGRDSAYASWFDIDWSRPITLPVLGDDAVLSITDGELTYYEHRFPLAPGSWREDEDPEAVHQRQHYRLLHYSRGDAELNYRRFFAVTSLAGVRQEDPAVFAATHERIARMVAEGVTGLRVDHPDGLVDPGQYQQRLADLAQGAWITVEKILEPGERLPDWPVAGTTGYDAMREVNGVFIDPEAEAEMTECYQRLTGDLATSAEHVERGKRMVVNNLLTAEVERIAALAPDVPQAGAAIAEVAVAFRVYRSYLPDGVADLDAALVLAEQRRPELASTLAALGPRMHDPANELARRLQQLSGATMAKGTEDTAFYRYARFVALNEVGSDPGEFGLGLDDFHALQTVRQRLQPASMTSLSTHDTKRGEDVRARLAVLAEIGPEWEHFATAFLARSAIRNRPFACLLAQTLIGTGPVERERLHAYAEKAMREASEETTWTAVDAEYEETVQAGIDLAYDDAALRDAWQRVLVLVEQPGWSNALGQKLVQLTMPGIPDVYQGTELWENSLVDPDNRRRVDFAVRSRMLGELSNAPAVDASGAAKLWVTATALRLRRDRPELFASYTPAEVSGPAAGHVIAYDRGG
ncbi:MAG: malto-oligosyltrehalose synthase, partial [Microlunatus sp.]|nr:malto-oligosyltrehalose synthase [Microlunatus sp.]